MTLLARHAAASEAAQRRRLSPWMFAWIVAVLAAVALYVLGVRRMDLDKIGDLGLVSIMNWQILTAFGLVAALAAWELVQARIRTLVMVILVMALVVFLFAIPNVADSAGASPTAYLHVGFIEYITENGKVAEAYDARFSWPAFFAAASYLAQMAGFDNALPFISWSPVFFELAGLVPLALLAHRAHEHARLAWLSIILFYCGVWFGQDYFSPQAVNFLLYLIVLAILVWLAVDGGGGLRRREATGRLGRILGLRLRTPELVRGMTGRTSFAVELVLVVIIAAIVVAHQLTPIGLIFSLVVLTLLGPIRYRWLWLVLVLVFVTWFSYGATDYWVGNLRGLLDNLLDPSASVQKGVSNRVGGSEIYALLQLSRLGYSALFLLGAVVGAIVMRRNKFMPVLLGLAFAPFAILAVQSYGGEGVIRCFLYAMPFLAILSAAAFSPIFRLPRIAAWFVLTVLIFGLSMALTTTRGVNAAFERVTEQQITVATELAAVMPAGSTVGVYEPYSPLAYTGVTERKVIVLGNYSGPDGTFDCYDDLVQCAIIQRPDFLLLTSSQQANGELARNLPTGWLFDQVVPELVQSGEYTILFSNEDAVAMQRVG